MLIKSRRMRWAGHVAHMAEMRNAYKILVRNTEGKGSLWRPWYRREHGTLLRWTFGNRV
jgi:hypothetical protein